MAFAIARTIAISLTYSFHKTSTILPLGQSYRNPILYTKYSFSSSLTMNNQNTTTTTNCTTDSNPTTTKTVRVVIKGRVQGVFYRNWTVENARGLGLKGWVRNRRDGSVEALFSGNPDSVNEMEQRCRRGPSYALVTGLQVFPSNEDPGNGFVKKSTV
ncbi:hypothetical protein IFM89_028946 [Coptis chinensis]|uniref:acylphosphatase n=1 Tax=Coptis chinensis TaxID=261450 RepID=A0A835H986_9MAGN|nr:hypothetical protein IFM89_028946 [Coptis chinensis]